MAIAAFLDPSDRAWLDWRWGWLAERIGADRIRSAQVFGSTEDLLPGNKALDDAGAEALAERVAAHLGLGTWPVLVLADHSENEEDYEQFAQALEQAHREPDVLVAGLQAEFYALPHRAALALIPLLVGAYLQRMGWIDLSDPNTRADCELAAVMLGGGVVLANNVVITEQGASGGGEVFLTQRTMELSEQSYGYALARFALLRGEAPPNWLRMLRADPRDFCKRSLSEFEAEPPTEQSPKPAWLLETWDQVEAAAAQEEHEGWTEEELTPPNLRDLRQQTHQPLYCRSCAYDIASLPPGDCPGCGKAFDPDDLKTVTLDKPFVMSESTHRRLTLLRRYSPLLIIGFIVLFIFLASLLSSLF